MQHQLRKNFTHLIIVLLGVMCLLIALSMTLATRIQAVQAPQEIPPSLLHVAQLDAAP